MKKPKSEEEGGASPKPLRDGAQVLIETASGKKLKCSVRNLVADSKGEWKFDIFRENNDEFLFKFTHKE